MRVCSQQRKIYLCFFTETANSSTYGIVFILNKTFVFLILQYKFPHL